MEKYQTFGRRVGAAILDSFVLVPINWSVSFIFFFVHTPTILASAVTGAIAAFYYILMHFYFGQTLGKMAAKVKVLDDSERPVNFGQSVLRSLPQLFPVMFAVSFSTAGASAAESVEFWASIIYGLTGAFFIVNVVVCLANEKRRALHDFLAGTIVVRTDV